MVNVAPFAIDTGVVKETVVAVLVIVPMAVPLSVPLVIVLNVKPEGKVIVTVLPLATKLFAVELPVDEGLVALSV